MGSGFGAGARLRHHSSPKEFIALRETEKPLIMIEGHQGTTKASPEDSGSTRVEEETPVRTQPFKWPFPLNEDSTFQIKNS